MTAQTWLLWRSVLFFALIRFSSSKKHHHPLNKTTPAPILPRAQDVAKAGSDKPHLANRLLDNFIVVPEYKLLFCFLEKVACTQFNVLFNEVRHKGKYGLPTYPKHHHTLPIWKFNTFQKVGWNKQHLEDALADREWQKVVFYRDPMERFLSAFLSKCNRGSGDNDGSQHCYNFLKQHHFGRGVKGFEKAVRKLALLDREVGHSEQLAAGHDAHFARQAEFCGGLNGTLQYYDTVVRLERATAREEVIKMLQKSGISATDLSDFDKLFPPHHEAGNNKAGKNPNHIQAADGHMLTYYNSTEIASTVLKHYAEDYSLFGVAIPPWAGKERPT